MSISERILSISETLSKKQNLLGKFIVDNIFEAAMMNAPQIAGRAGVSKATLTRFVHTLGFESFADFHTELRKETLRNQEMKFRQEPYLDSNNSVYQKVFDLEMELMREALENMEQEIFEKSAEMLFEADQVMLVGGPIHNFLAFYAGNFMCGFRDNVRVVSQRDMEFLSLLRNAGQKSCALVFSYPRYSQEVQTITEMLSEKKVPVIGMTDSKLSPIVPFAKYTLLTPQKYIILADASASAMALIHSLMVAMYRKHSDRIRGRLEKYEKDILTTDMFVYKDYNFVKQL